MEKERNIKKEYEKLEKKYSLPKFEKLDEDFNISKIAEKEFSFLASEIRRAMNEKFSAYLVLFENFLSPAGPPIFVFSLLRGISQENKKKIQEMYKTLAKFQLEIMKLDTIYSEEKEVKFINISFKKWQDLKLEIMKIVESFEVIFESESEENARGYLG